SNDVGIFCPNELKPFFPPVDALATDTGRNVPEKLTIDPSTCKVKRKNVKRGNFTFGNDVPAQYAGKSFDATIAEGWINREFKTQFTRVTRSLGRVMAYRVIPKLHGDVFQKRRPEIDNKPGGLLQIALLPENDTTARAGVSVAEGEIDVQGGGGNWV